MINSFVSLMYELQKNGKVFTSKFVGTGPSSYEKRIYQAAVSQSLRNTGVKDGNDGSGTSVSDIPFYDDSWRIFGVTHVKFYITKIAENEVKFISKHLVLYSEEVIEFKCKICHLFLNFTLGLRQTVGCEPIQNTVNFKNILKKFTKPMVTCLLNRCMWWYGNMERIVEETWHAILSWSPQVEKWKKWSLKNGRKTEGKLIV